MEITLDQATQDNQQQAPVELATLRKDLDFYPGTTSLEGYPTYIIHDRFQHLFYNIGLTEYEILKRWHLNDPEAIAEDILNTTTLYVNEEDVVFLNDYLQRNQLCEIRNEEQRARISGMLDKKVPFSPMKLFKYFMINIRLARPDRFLTNTYWMVRFVFSRPFWWVMGILLLAGLYLVIRDFASFTSYARDIFTLQGAAFIVIALVISKLFHEFGHAYMCKHLGLAVPKFGLRLMIILPFFYTDTNESWKLKSRRHRFMIGASGVLSECALAICAMFLWGILDDGPARNTCFYLFVVSWISSLAINLTPFLRWDGYYMFSDLIGIQNLQKRGFALGKWQIRQWLFGWKDERPISLTPGLHKLVLGYAYGAWIKRVFIFLAIGILIYQRVFKVLGIFLLTMQVNNFILLPIYKEIKVWWQEREKMNWNRHSITTLVVFSGLLAMLFYPWQTTVRAPATVSPRVQAILYAPEASQISQAGIKKNDFVKRGQLLLQLENTNLEYDIRLAKSEVDILQTSLNRFGDQDFLESRDVLQQQLSVAVEKTTGLIDTFRKLKVVAPFDGEVVDVHPSLKPGTWVGADTALAMIADKSSLEIYAYIAEKDLTRIDQTGGAVFYPENPRLAPIVASIIAIDTSETQSLKHPMLAAKWGGEIAASNHPTDGLRPTNAYYRLRLAIQPEDIENIRLEMRGTLHIAGQKHSIATDIYRKAVSVLIRESGF